jgi:hypothetical protein
MRCPLRASDASLAVLEGSRKSKCGALWPPAPYRRTCRPEHHKDLCAAKLTLDRIVRFEESLSTAGVRQGTIYYTYHVTAMPWALSADAQRVFPLVARIIKGEGTLQLEQRMQLGTDGWTALNGL